VEVIGNYGTYHACVPTIPGRWLFKFHCEWSRIHY